MTLHQPKCPFLFSLLFALGVLFVASFLPLWTDIESGRMGKGQQLTTLWDAVTDLRRYTGGERANWKFSDSGIRKKCLANLQTMAIVLVVGYVFSHLLWYLGTRGPGSVAWCVAREEKKKAREARESNSEGPSGVPS